MQGIVFQQNKETPQSLYKRAYNFSTDPNPAVKIKEICFKPY